ncbi:hypothetical protein [Flavobacterium sp.]|uniref:hypothetical protein n=1 Tax=Flavobacterium sp. TaxID=239 RepID=UPI0025C30AD7|nr:hypothetical protein [Flavobacterium sp.]MBA4155819.1 hypothetical protein [Flavobacterium sp.]
MKELFPNFINDTNVYNAAKIYWQTAFDKISKQVSDPWDEWFNNYYLNGQPIQNGNPILSKICKKNKRGLRVIQIPYEEGEVEMTAFIDCYEADLGSIHQLVIYCILTEVSFEIAYSLMFDWVINMKNEKEMENIIDSKILINR